MDHAKMIEELKRYIKLIYSQSQNFESMIAVYVAMLHPSLMVIFYFETCGGSRCETPCDNWKNDQSWLRCHRFLFQPLFLN